MASCCVPTSLVEQACAVAAAQGWYKVEASFTLPCGSRASIVGWRPNTQPAQPAAPRARAAVPSAPTQDAVLQSTSVNCESTQTTSEDGGVPVAKSKASKKRAARKRKITNGELDTTNGAILDISAAAELPPQPSNPRTRDLKREPVLEPPPVGEPARPTSPVLEPARDPKRPCARDPERPPPARPRAERIKGLATSGNGVPQKMANGAWNMTGVDLCRWWYNEVTDAYEELESEGESDPGSDLDCDSESCGDCGTCGPCRACAMVFGELPRRRLGT